MFRRNVEALHVDLTLLDMVVITHAHGDHTSGLRYVLGKNPKVKLYVPDDPYFTGTVLPPAFLTTDARPELRPKMRYSVETIGRNRRDGHVDRHESDSRRGIHEYWATHAPCFTHLREAGLQGIARDIAGIGHAGRPGRFLWDVRIQALSESWRLPQRLHRTGLFQCL
ncbi:MAG: MBL fold metallo-hydrolase [Acidobacteriales bacterium]|nr:MBL fold metallo-hydrolase [Terriglobales bacterium]